MSSEGQFDPKYASALLLDIANEPSLPHLLEKLKRQILKRPAVARVYAWLVQKGDLCASCERRFECADQTRCLHLFAHEYPVAATVDSKESARLDHRFERVPIGVDIPGQIAAKGKQFVLRNLDQDPGELAVIPWLKEERIRGLNGVPIIYRGEVLGVLMVFVRSNVPEEAAIWGRIFANHVAGVIAQTRAMDEIKQLKVQLEQQNAYLQEEILEAKAFGNLVGQSAALRQIISQIDLVAPTDASVLILGDTGTGKELVAHEIHQRSRRKDRPLIRVNCASIPKELYESEFFGHAKGAFTGAIKDRAGRFEAAEGGTLFLDEIGEMPLDVQSKLLRALQEKCFERVGEDRVRRADVRIIAATNRNLKNEVAAGRFREDLFYRLNVFPIQVVSLRERRDDIPLLAKHFIELSANELRSPHPRLTRAGLVKLQAYDWPGNIRELRNVIERAVIIARGGILEFDLPQPQTKPAARNAPPAAGQRDEADYLTDAEYDLLGRENLLKVLTKAGWKIKGPNGAAELLGAKPATVFSRVRKMKLKPNAQ